MLRWPFFVQGNSTLRSGTVKSACAYAFWGEVVNSSRSREYRWGYRKDDESNTV